MKNRDKKAGQQPLNEQAKKQANQGYQNRPDYDTDRERGEKQKETPRDDQDYDYPGNTIDEDLD